MNRITQSLIVALMGGAVLSITISGRFTLYVRPYLEIPLIISGIVLVGVSLISLVTAVISGRRAHDQQRHGSDHPHSEWVDIEHALDDEVEVHGDGHGHDHDRSRAPWLILAPVLVLLLVAPPALGVSAVRRNAGSQAIEGLAALGSDSPAGSSEASGGSDASDSSDGSGAGGGAPDRSGAGSDLSGAGPVEGYAPNDGSGKAIGTKAFAKQRPTRKFPALPGGTDPALGVKQFVLRALYDADRSVVTTPVTVTGFIAPSSDGYTGGYTVARLVISCCAADASPMQLHVEGTAPAPEGAWVNAVVTAQDGTANQANDYVPTVSVTSVSPTDQPNDPYEH